MLIGYTEICPVLRPGIGWSQRRLVIFQELLKASPEFELKLLGVRQLFRRYRTRSRCYRTSPVIWLRYDVELRRSRGSRYSPKLNLKAKEAEFFCGDLVQPVHSGPVLFRESRCDPNDFHSVEASSVGHKLPQVLVVRRLQLIFNQDP